MLKRIWKRIYDWLEIEYIGLSEDEAILRFCSSDPHFEDKTTPSYKKFYFLKSDDGEVIGNMSCFTETWHVMVINDAREVVYQGIVHTVSEIKTVVKTYCR